MGVGPNEALENHVGTNEGQEVLWEFIYLFIYLLLFFWGRNTQEGKILKSHKLQLLAN